ncbi:MAG: shikimate dehydrogenase [Bacteroidaceae bacterium]|nr:shikimate dehydrogenase [Bacteroidaceae bacterium]
MKRYGLIGYPLGHSFSRNFFNEKFASENIQAEYVNFEIPSIEQFPEIIRANPNLAGLNVTIPYKEAVIPYLNRLDTDAAAIGAVNVIRINRISPKETELVGCNSDVIGFSRSIEPLLEPHHKKALILGTGGASKAVNFGLKKLGLETLFVSRSRHDEHTLTYQELTPELMDEYKVIVNTTPVGMYPNADEYPDIPYECLTHKHLLYDLLYNPDTTLFMKKGSEQGAVVKNGIEMLLLQAFEAWDIWNR